MKNAWSKCSWRNFQAQQQPEWKDVKHLNETISKLNNLPALVFSGETRRLKRELTEVNKGNSFILQVGNCAESFSDCNGPKIHNFLRIVLQMTRVIEFQANKNVVKIGRIAGQYAKPRSSDSEVLNGINFPVYRGDNVNDYSPSIEGREANADRLLEGYFRSAATLNLIRAFTQGGYGDIQNLSDWKRHFFSNEISNLEYYKNFERNVTNSLFFNKKKKPSISPRGDLIYTSHEALLLDYEEAFARIDTTTGDYYSTSAHLLWIGDRTRQVDGAHVEFARGIGNPIGIKVGPTYSLKELIHIINKINPFNEEGKIILINRMGVKFIDSGLRPLIREVKKNKLKVIWSCDPMHGNTFSHEGYKVRSFEDIVSEIKSFFEICKEEKVVPGGIHLEITGEYVTECIGGLNGLTFSNLSDNYDTKVDPRLNAAQALEIAFIISTLI
ncbi:MAG: 3-deoxy-7-phosphoheptulonate synthase [Lentimicrobiaceae bacterium]|nr:3-deoxy-7-phosphoheptulonate synthase [Lentimicrobiaceae bacterium]